jgi:serine/arginine repetitive matrix protein 2
LTETHQIAQAKEEKNARFKEAFGIKDDYKGGTAFNQELQAIERMKEKEAKEKEAKKYESR